MITTQRKWLMDSWKTLFALSLAALFCGCASEPHQNASCDLQTLLLQQQRQIQRSLIAKDIATLPEQENPFRGSFGQPRVANDPNNPTETSQVNAYNKDLHEKEMDAWVTFELAQSVPKQSLEAQSPYGINRPYSQPIIASHPHHQPQFDQTPTAWESTLTSMEDQRPTSCKMVSNSRLYLTTVCSKTHTGRGLAWINSADRSIIRHHKSSCSISSKKRTNTLI